MCAIARYFTMQKSNSCSPINFINVHQKQCAVLWGLRESRKYALYNVRIVCLVFGIKNVD